MKRHQWLTHQRLYWLIFFSLVLVFLFLTLGSIVLGHLSLTYDEPLHFKYGEQILQLDTNRFDDSKMPVSVLNVLASRLAQKFIGRLLSNEWQVMSTGRLATIGVGLLLGLLIFFWARQMYGRWVGLLSFGLFVFEPNLVAHAQLITTDLYAVATFTLALYVFWQFFKSANLQRACLVGLALGLAQIAKYSNILLIPLFLLLALLLWWNGRKTHQQRSFRRDLLSFLKYSLIMFGWMLLVINLGFLFNGTGLPLADYPFKSDFFRSLQAHLAGLAQIPLPLPYPYLDGLDFVLFRERSGDGYGNIYLLGELRKAAGFPGYYFIASLFKVPLALLGLWLASSWQALRKFSRASFFENEIFLLLPALVYAIYFNFFNRAQIGIRFYLIIFPILIIFSASFFTRWPDFSRRARRLAVLAGLWLVLSVASYFPNYLSYFNELVLDRNQAYRILADSNLDWGQNRANLAEFLARNTEFQFEPTLPTTGKIIIGVNELVGVVGKPEDYAWLRENFQPSGNFKNSYLIYEITTEDLEKIR